jgi:hypothetical protein
MEKKYNSSGQKAYQRDDKEDRSLVYRNWLRTIPSNGFFLDIDLVKWRYVDGVPVPVAITELTRCDSETAGQSYLDAIINRWYVRDKQGVMIEKAAELMGVPAFLVLFQKDMKWTWVFSLQTKEWKYYPAEEWAEFLMTL